MGSYRWRLWEESTSKLIRKIDRISFLEAIRLRSLLPHWLPGACLELPAVLFSPYPGPLHCGVTAVGALFTLRISLTSSSAASLTPARESPGLLKAFVIRLCCLQKSNLPILRSTTLITSAQCYLSWTLFIGLGTRAWAFFGNRFAADNT